MKYNLKPMHRAILEVWRECHKICQRHNLRVFVTYGTALGAMRHNGFIPWDDDFDVMMPRPDYNKFMQFAAQELPPYMKWHSIESDASYRLLFGKVKDERPEVLERVQKESNLNLCQGIFVDFFPMDGLPSSILGCLVWNVWRSMIRRFKCFRKTLPEMQNWISRIDYDKAKNVGWLLAPERFPRFIFRRSWFESSHMVNFGEVDVPVPAGIEFLLNCLYGDWRKLPPEDQRKPCHQTLV